MKISAESEPETKNVPAVLLTGIGHEHVLPCF